MAEPIGAPSAISREYPNDVARLRPCLMKNTGSQVTNPYNNVLIVIRHTEPTIMRESKGAVNSVASSPERVAVEGPGAAGPGPPRARSTASALRLPRCARPPPASAAIPAGLYADTRR